MIPADLLELLRCPQSGQALTWADTEVLADLNARLAPAADAPVTEGLLRVDRVLLYPVRDGIPVLLAEEAIIL